MSRELLIGTNKGLFVLHGDDGRTDWELEGPHLPGWSVYHAIRDPRSGVLYACANSPVYGGTLHRSEDGGRTWKRSEVLGLPESSGLKLAATWHVEPGRAEEPSRLWLGGDPGVLFRSDDGGVSWNVNQTLLEHPTRERWNPGAGGLCLHSIQVTASRLYVAISAAGAFRSEDDGGTFTAINYGVAADFFPDNPFPEVGQCVHKLLVHPEQTERLWQQNHCGVYRSDDRGAVWERLEGNGLPSGFGFPIALDPAEPDAAWVVPQEGAENRVTSGGRLGVYRTRDGGASWELASNGLPEQAWVSVLREGMSYDDGGIYLGTQSGSVFATADGGDSWVEAASQLPPVLSVEAAQWQ